MPVPVPVLIDPSAAVPPRRLLRGSEQLTGMVGHRLLVGISYLDDDQNVAATEQFCGRVLDVGDGVVIVERPGTVEPAVLPADAAAYRPAPAGTYRLSSSDDVVVDPDFITTWRLSAGAPSR